MATPYYERDGITIYCGDCREILPTLEAASIDLVLTDPPYGDNHDTDYTRFSKGKVRKTDGSAHPRYRHAAVKNDDEPFDPSHLLPFGRVICFGATRFSDRLPVGSWIIWDKRTPTGSKGVMSDGEAAWFNHGRGLYIYSHTWDGFNRASEQRDVYHPTQKPVVLMAWILERWTKPGDLILDPYMGSGPIARACMDLGRRYIGIEIERQYVEIAVRRLQQSVMSFPEVA